METEIFNRQIDFKFTSKAFQPLDDKGDGKRRVRVVASSSLEDLSGDVVTPNALREMADSAKGMTIFRNHSYKVPGDIFGWVENAWVQQSRDFDNDGKPIHELAMDVGVFEKNPDNVMTHEAVVDGTKIGVSIGAMIPKGAAKKNANGGITFDSLKLKEASIVGIPQNTRSWVQYATKALRSVEANPGEDDEDTNQEFVTTEDIDRQFATNTTYYTSSLVPQTQKARVWVTQNEKGSNVTVDTDPVAEGDIQEQVDPASARKKDAEPEIAKESVADWPVVDETGDELPEGDQAAADAFYAEMDALNAGSEDVSFAAELDLVKAPLTSEARNNLPDSAFACPSKRKYPIHDKAHLRNALSRCGDPSNDQCGCSTVRAAAAKAGIGDSSKAAEPIELIKEAEVVTANPDEAPPAQELEQSEPDNAEAAADSGDPLTSDILTNSASVLADIVKSQNAALLDTRKRLGDAESALAAKEQELRETKANLKLAKEIVERIAKTPLGRKGVVASAVSEFESLEERYGGIYSSSVLKSLERK